MTFHVGQRVVCVDVSPNQVGQIPNELVQGAIYTIAGFDDAPDWTNETGIYLEEIAFDASLPNDSFKTWRFRPLITRKTDISFAHEILRKVSNRVPA